MKKTLLTAVVGGAFILGVTAGCGGVTEDTATPSVAPSAAPSAAPPAKKAPADTRTPGQKNAQRAAESYLATAPFSRTGLIKQLEFEKYSKADATWAVEHVKVNWNEQAAKSAKSYLETQAFSRDGLIQQLTFEGFTAAEAKYGVDKAGL
ncbi:hypothetical protein B1A87_007285 [Arthrobacter sp. KBS0703]|nr:hypothetical protein B1A87_007285 [Arthrobacter sp. KBS0703]